MEDTNPELEQFRQQWRAEVSARTQTDGSRDIKSTKTTRRPPPITSLGSNRGVKPAHENEEEEPPTFHSLDGPREDAGYGESSEAVAKEPESALEHYEQAVERETTGKLGESLSLYRKAFRVSSFSHYASRNTDQDRWMIELIKSTKANISHRRTLPRNLPIRTHQVPLLQFRILPTTP